MSVCDALLEPGRNCWKTVSADRLGFLFEGASYFAAAREAMLQAERSIVILGWELNTRTELVPGEEATDGFPTELGPFFERLLEAKPDLEIFILIWDYSVVYVAEREWQMLSETLRHPHPRLHFRSDSALPATASHHQKVILVDETVAFTGGLDLSVWRWDTEDHVLNDERRVDPAGKPYDPYHDIQMLVEGEEAVRALAELCRYRWKRATGADLPELESSGRKPFQLSRPSVEIDNVELALARTYVAYEPHPSIHEIEQLNLDIVAGAEDYLYFENQYFSSSRLADAIADRLREPEGPDVVIVLNKDTGGWLEETTMGVVRDCLFERLTKADEHGRLRLFHPVVYDEAGEPVRVYVHSKVIVADDCLIKVGSANLSNRSMRVDSELDVLVADAGRRDSVVAFRNHVLGIHFGTDAERIAEAFAKKARFSEVIDGLLKESGGSLRVLDFAIQKGLRRKLAESQMLDPDEPMDPRFWIRSRISEDQRPSVGRRLLVLCGILLFGIALAGLLNWGWGSVVDQEYIEEKLEVVQSSPWSLVVLFGVFVLAGMTGVPLNFIVVASVVVFGPVAAFFCAYSGAHVSAAIVFAIGRTFGMPLVKKIRSEYVGKLEHLLAERGILSVALIRLVPVAPFTVVNMVAGSLKLKFSTFNLGTVLGMAPGMLAVTLLTHQVETAIVEPSAGSITLLVVLFLAIAGAVYSIWRSLTSRSEKGKAGGA
ncbi:MAG: VTT domain-containing protein [Verrucomicrobiales bacterium]